MVIREEYPALLNIELIREQNCKSQFMSSCKEYGSDTCPKTCGLYKSKSPPSSKEKGLPKLLK